MVRADSATGWVHFKGIASSPRAGAAESRGGAAGTRRTKGPSWTQGRGCKGQAQEAQCLLDTVYAGGHGAEGWEFLGSASMMLWGGPCLSDKDTVLG